MEEDISDAIYGDLGEFEFNEKLKEQCEKIENLTDQLNQSVLTITDLQAQMKDLRKTHLRLEKNSSSLLATARVEIKRKDEYISQLQQKIDNQVFRRRNTFTTGVQAQTTADPLLFNNNANHNCIKNTSDQPQHQPVSDLSQYRIPKKIPFARQENDKEHQNRITACNGIENRHDHGEPRRHLPKKNPQARRYAEDEIYKKQTHGEKDRMKDPDADNDRRVQHMKQPHDDKEKVQDRLDELRDNRRYRDYKKSHSNSNDQKRDSSRNSRKRSRGRSSSDEMDRHPKRRRRPDSTTHRQRSRSRPARIEERVSKTKRPRNDHWKRGKGDRTDGVKSRNDSVSSIMKEKDLEVVLIAQKGEMDCTDTGQPPAQNRKSSHEHRKRKSSHYGDPTMKMTYEDGNKDLCSANDGNVELNINRPSDAGLVVIAESDSTAKELPVHIQLRQINTDVINASPEMVEVLPVASEKSSQELPLIKAATSTNNLKLCSHIRETTSKPTEENVTEDDGRKNTSTSESTDGKSDRDDVPKEVSESVPSSESINRKDDEDDLPKEELSRSMSSDEKVTDVPKNTSESVTSKSIDEHSDGVDASKELSKSALPDSINRSDLPMQVSTSSECTDEKVNGDDMPNDVSESAQLPNDENSNMDIDYELMERGPVTNQTILPCKESDRKMLEQNSPKVTSPTVNNDVSSNQAKENDESFISMNVVLQKNNCDSTLNSSQERHILSKSKEYTVEDAGYEIRIFLTKKRRKNKAAKVNP